MKLRIGNTITLLAITAVFAGSTVAGSTTGFKSDLRANTFSLQKAAKPDLSGKWDLNVSTDGGPVSAKADFKVASDGTITGTIESEQYGVSKISGGSVNDASFSIKFSISADGNAIEVGMNGTFDEKSMKGSGSAGDASFSFTGTRAASAQK
jgi:hypothetical protein